jgi:hypothetical protein
LENNYPAGPGVYAELAIRLHALAATANDSETAAELVQLAARYERLAARAEELTDKYLPILPDAPAN